jgi:hypothetical protein
LLARLDAAFDRVDAGEAKGVYPFRNARGLTPEELLQAHDRPIEGLCEKLSLDAWATRSLPEPEPLLGDLVTKTTRTFFVGATGLGKTMFGLAMAHGIASGKGFMHWRSKRPARVLYLDGEMPGELIKARAKDLLRRDGSLENPENLLIFARASEAAVAETFHEIGRMSPLNTTDGQRC